MSHIDKLPDKDLSYILLGTPPEAINRAYWAVKIGDSGEPEKDWISETHPKLDLVNGTVRNTDWTADVVKKDFCGRIQEIWLFCPPNRISITGNVARLPIQEPNSAFQLKISSYISNIAAGYQKLNAMLVGRVNDKASGEVVVLIWDQDRDCMWEPWHAYLKDGHLGTWRDGIAPIRGLAYEQIGLVL